MMNVQYFLYLMIYIDYNTKSKMAKRILETNEKEINADEQEKDFQK